MSRPRSRSRPLAVALALTLAPAGAGAQDSLEVIERGRERFEAWDVAGLPFELALLPLDALADGFGRVLTAVEQGRLAQRLALRYRRLLELGLTPGLGGIGPNSGVGASVGFARQRRQTPSLAAGTKLAATLNGYWLVEARLGARRPGGAAAFEAFGRWERRPRDEFFGVGNATHHSDRAAFRLDQASAGLIARVRPAAGWSAGLEASWRSGARRAGEHPRLPSVGGDSSPPGFRETRRYISYAARVRWVAGLPQTTRRSGAWAAAGYEWNRALVSGSSHFARVHLEAGAEAPLDSRRRSVALELRYRSVMPQGRGDVPFYELEELGGPRDLPAYRSRRFRDLDLLAGKTEYRFRVWSDPRDLIWTDGVLQVGAGMVGGHLGEELRADRLHLSYAYGLRVLSGAGELARLQLATSSEGWRVSVLAGSLSP